MKMLCLWLVNQLFVLIIIAFILLTWALGLVLGGSNTIQDVLNTKTINTIMVIAAIVGFIPAIITARFAKDNFDEMISSGFIRWTSSINLWQSEWKFFFKTLFLGWVFYGVIAFFIGLFVSISFLGWMWLNHNLFLTWKLRLTFFFMRPRNWQQMHSLYGSYIFLILTRNTRRISRHSSTSWYWRRRTGAERLALLN